MSLSTWTNLVLPRLPGAAEALVDEETAQVIYDFCLKSTAWREMVYGLNIVANNREITPVVGDGSEATVSGVLRAYFNGQQLTQYSHAPQEFESDVPNGYSTKPGSPSVIVLSNLPTISLTNAVDAWVYLKPTDPTSYVPTLLSDQYWEYIFDGILGRLYGQPDKPYTSVISSSYHLKRYRQGIREAKDMANRGFTGNAQNWVFPKFGV